MGTVSINGNEFLVDIKTYRERDMTDYAPRATVPGGALAYSELMTYQPVLMTDWRHGFGFHWHTDAEGYMRTEGNVDTRQAGLACLYTAPILSDYDAVDHGEINGFTQFGTNLYAWGGGYIKTIASGGSAWSEVDTGGGSTGDVLSALATKDYFFFCRDDARIRKYNGSTFSDAGANGSSIDFHWLTIHSGYIYAGVQNSNLVHYSSSETLADLDGTSTDPGKITIGAGGHATIGAISYAGYLYVARPDGIWSVGDDKIARKVIDCANETDTGNFKSMVIFNGYLIFPIKDRLMQWNGTRLTDITPPRVTDTWPYTVYRDFDNLVVVGNYLYLTAKPTTVGTASSAAEDTDLICFDGIGWFKLATLVDGYAVRSVTAMGYYPEDSRLFYNVDIASGSANTHEVYYISFDGNSDYPYPYFQTSVDTNCLITSRIDCGFRRVKKSTPSMFVDANNIDTDRYIKVYYQLDGSGSWTLWGNITSDGTTELTSPGGNDTIEYDYIQLKFVFYTTSATQTPILEGFVLRAMLRPNVFYGWNFDIIGASHYRDGVTEDVRTAKTLVEQLQTARDSKSPIAFVDIYGTSYKAYVSTVSMTAKEIHAEKRDGYSDVEYRINVNIVEAKTT